MARQSNPSCSETVPDTIRNRCVLLGAEKCCPACRAKYNLHRTQEAYSADESVSLQWPSTKATDKQMQTNNEFKKSIQNHEY